jgi:hypothetical protein
MCWPVESRNGTFNADQTAAASSAPVVAHAVAIATSGTRGCVLGVDGALACWGTFMGEGMTPQVVSVPDAPPKPTVIAVRGDIGGGIVCLGNDEGIVKCESDGAGFFATIPPKDARLVSLSAGTEHICGVDKQRRVICWGVNSYGQLGVEDRYDGSVPDGIVPGLSDVAEVAAGGGHTCARKLTGQVVCWGANDFGQLGDGNSGSSRSQPRDVAEVSDAVSIAAGEEHTCAVRRGGQLACWGENVGGGLGDGTQTNRARPFDVPGIDDAIRVAAGFSQTCVLRRSRRITCWGMSNAQSGTIDLVNGTTTPRDPNR